MSLFRLSRAAEWLSAPLIGDDAVIESVGSDSRDPQPGQLFVALEGPRFDGHAFAPQAVRQGAAGLMVSRRLELDVPQLLVSDTRVGLGQLAAAWRSGLPGQVVAVTGSNGKTTSKEMIAALLGQAGTVLATRGNLNNDIGLPLTLLGARDEDYLVLEMGANHPGEIAGLTRIGRPQVALITNAGRAHLEGFGSLEGVARAKGEIIEGLPADGTFVLNADDPWAPLWRDMAAPRRVLSFGRRAAAEVMLDKILEPLSLRADGFHVRYALRTPRGRLEIELRLAGVHNLLNALAAVAVGEALAIEPAAIQAGLAGLRPVPGRMRALAGVNGSGLIDDSYNANPDSLRAALSVLGDLPGRRWLLLGDLGELGEQALQLHREVAADARRAGVEKLWAVGPLSAETVAAFGAGGRHFTDQPSLIDAIGERLRPRDIVLIKGSRSAAMERVTLALAVEQED